MRANVWEGIGKEMKIKREVLCELPSREDNVSTSIWSLSRGGGGGVKWHPSYSLLFVTVRKPT